MCKGVGKVVEVVHPVTRLDYRRSCTSYTYWKRRRGVSRLCTAIQSDCTTSSVASLAFGFGGGRGAGLSRHMHTN